MYTSLVSIAFLISIPFNKLDSNIYLVPSGKNIVFKMNTDGVVVTGTYDVNHDGGIYNPYNSDIKRGDIIKKANNIDVNNIAMLTDVLSKENKVSLEILRNTETIQRNLDVYKVNNITRTGLYVKDKVIGVGTLTYINPNNMIYGALGHEVIDNDTHNLVDVTDGIITENDVISITKGSNGDPGEKNSQTNLNNIVGNIQINTNKGMYGKYLGKVNKKTSLAVAKYNDIKKGEAKVLTVVKGNKIEEFDIIITDLKKQELDQTKGICFKITDKRLLDISGGVYSGMSGSPIIQNNRIIGAVTHVLIDDIKCGYGLYIENMLYKENIIQQSSTKKHSN